jgi:site-specific DNA-methyltransferase (adenine-specific)
MHTAFTHAHETLLWASKGKGARHIFTYDLINSPDSTVGVSSIWRIPTVPRRESSRATIPPRNP